MPRRFDASDKYANCGAYHHWCEAHPVWKVCGKTCASWAHAETDDVLAACHKALDYCNHMEVFAVCEATCGSYFVSKLSQGIVFGEPVTGNSAIISWVQSQL